MAPPRVSLPGSFRFCHPPSPPPGTAMPSIRQLPRKFYSILFSLITDVRLGSLWVSKVTMRGGDGVSTVWPQPNAKPVSTITRVCGRADLVKNLRTQIGLPSPPPITNGSHTGCPYIPPGGIILQGVNPKRIFRFFKAFFSPKGFEVP